MTCPYLKEVSVVYCRAFPVKKPVPIDQVTTASTCEGDGFNGCALYRDALTRAGRSVEEETSSPNPVSPKGATP
jgi:hypothetical protein